MAFEARERRRAAVKRQLAKAGKVQPGAQATAPSRMDRLKNGAGSAGAGRFASAIATKQPDSPAPLVQANGAAGAIKSRTSRWGFLDPSALGADMLAAAEGGRFSFCNEVLEELGPTRRDDVALGFMEHLPADAAGEKRLDALALSNPGRRLLDRLFDELTSGRVGEDEQRQANRIIAAKSRGIPAASAGSKSPMIFPYRPPALFTWSAAPITARRLPDGRIWVKQPVRVRFTDEFTNETGTLPPRLFIDGIEIPENTVVRVKRYDLGGKVDENLALYLVQLSNETERSTAAEVAQTALLAAGFIGSAGVVAGRAAARVVLQDVGTTFGELLTKKGLLEGAKLAWKPFLISGATSGASNAFFQWYYGKQVRQIKWAPVVVDFVLGGAFGAVIARVWKKIPLDAKLSPKYIWTEIFQEARNWAPLREAAGTLVRQQLILSPVQGVFNVTRAFVFDTDLWTVFKVGFVDFFLGMAASYALQFNQLGKAGDLWWGPPAPGKTVHDRLHTGWGAAHRSVLGQVRQAGIRATMGLSAVKDPVAAEAVKDRTAWWGNLQESKLGADMLAFAERGEFSFGLKVLDQLARPERDDVSLAFMEHLPEDAEGEKRLDALAASEGGLHLLDRLHFELTASVGFTSNIGISFPDERRQAARIVAAKSRRQR